MILRHENLEKLLEKFPIADFDVENLAHLDLLHQLSVAEIGKNKGKLSNLPPLEKHPYLQQLNVNADLKGLMIGTLPPITYLADKFELPKLSYGSQRFLERPEIPYFHGNRGSFWKFSPFNFDAIINHSIREEKPLMISDNLASYKIAYTDMIQYCQRSFAVKKKETIDKYPADDVCLNNISLNNNVYDFLLNNTSLDRLYFTNSYAFGMGDSFFTAKGMYQLKKRDAFQLFLKGANLKGITIDISLPDNVNWLNINEAQRSRQELKSINELLRAKVVLKMRLTKNNTVKVFDVISSVSPSAIGGTRTTSQLNSCVIKYSDGNNVDIKDSSEGLIRQSLKAFFNGDVKSLIKYNA